MRYRRKAVGDIGFDHPPSSLPGLIHENLPGIVRRTLRVKPETARQKIGLKDRSSTIFNAACTMRSRTAAIANGLKSLLSGLGINTLRTGSGRQLRLRPQLLSRGSIGTTAASDSLPTPHPLPGSSPVIGQGSSTDTAIGSGWGGPVDRHSG